MAGILIIMVVMMMMSLSDRAQIISSRYRFVAATHVSSPKHRICMGKRQWQFTRNNILYHVGMKLDQILNLVQNLRFNFKQ